MDTFFFSFFFFFLSPNGNRLFTFFLFLFFFLFLLFFLFCSNSWLGHSCVVGERAAARETVNKHNVIDISY